MNRMFVVLSALMLAGGSAVAAPLFCVGKDTDGNRWQVAVASDHLSAEVFQDADPVDFGNLRCTNIFTMEVRPEGSPIVSCYSKNVADDGFNVYLYRPHRRLNIVGELSAVWIGGTRPVANLKCIEAMHR